MSLYDVGNAIFEALTESPVGIIMGIVLMVALVCFVVLTFFILFHVIDSGFRSVKKGVGKVITTKFTPAHTKITDTYNNVAETELPQPVFYPDDWSVSVEVDGKVGNISVSREFYDSLAKEEQVLADYMTNRLSGRFYLKGLCRL